MPKRKLESDEQSKIIKYLESEGAYVRKVIVANKSTLDLLCCLKGKFIAFEIKRGEKEARRTPELQLYNARQVRKAGGQAFIVSKLSEVIEIMTSYKTNYNFEQKFNDSKEKQSSIRS